MNRSVMSFDVCGLAGVGFISQPVVLTTAEIVLQGCVVPVNNLGINHEDDGGSGCTTPLILYVIITRTSRFAPVESDSVKLFIADRKPGGSQSWYRRRGE